MQMATYYNADSNLDVSINVKLVATYCKLLVFILDTTLRSKAIQN